MTQGGRTPDLETDPTVVSLDDVRAAQAADTAEIMKKLIRRLARKAAWEDHCTAMKGQA